jgi:hypothetical protein
MMLPLAKVGGIVNQPVRGVFGNHLEAVVLRHIDRLEHCPMHDVSNFEPVFRRLSLA